MGRITTYTGIGQTQGKTALEDDDVLLLDGTNGSRKITAKELANAMMDKGSKSRAALPVGRSGLYRGANLGSGATFSAASTSDQRSAISDGSFDGLFIGDYWTVNGRVYRIADFNYWKGTGDTDFNTNHVVLVPDNSFGNGQMNSTNTTTGAYVGSEMYTDANSVLNTARTAIATDFGGYLASHKIYLPNAVTDGKESAGAWYNSTVELMSEIMVYGCKIRNPGNFYTTEKSQLALFRLNPAMVNLRYNYWLRDVVSATYFARVANRGVADDSNASFSRGVRPAFPIKGTA
jgi:hypothetical protein